MTNTNRFQPGDRVRVKSGPAPVDIGLTPGRVYTVAHVDDFGLVSVLGNFRYFHPSHFELAMRAVAEETYCLLDTEGDWWILDDALHTVPVWRMVDRSDVIYDAEDGIERLTHDYGIDAEPTAPAETYCLKDTAGDWWVSDGVSHSLITPRGTYSTRATPEQAADQYDIDAEPTAQVETYCLLDGEGDWWHSPDGEGFRLWSWSDHGIDTRTLDTIVELHGIDTAESPDDGGEYETEMALAYEEPGNSTGPSLHFEAVLTPGDRVEYIGGGEVETERLIGKFGTVAEGGNALADDPIMVDWDENLDPRGVLAANLRKADPTPLAAGDWVKVLARVEHVYDNGSIKAQTFQSDGTGNGPSIYAIASAITRTDEVPEWAQPARCTSLWSDGVHLWRCDMEAAHDRALHDSGEGAASWRDEVAYGRVEVTER